MMWDAKERILIWSSGGRVGKRGNDWGRGGGGGGRWAGGGGRDDDEQGANEDEVDMAEVNCVVACKVESGCCGVRVEMMM